MSVIKMKVIIAGRTYPLTVSEGEDKLVQEAADRINNMLQKFRENYAVKDVQDLLAMTALQLASKGKNTGAPTESSSPSKEVQVILDEIESLLG